MRSMARVFVSAIALYLMAPHHVAAQGWYSWGSKHLQLKEMVIVDAGESRTHQKEVRNESLPYPFTRTVTWIEFVGSTGTSCFDIDGFGGLSWAPALLLINEGTRLFLAEFETMPLTLEIKVTLVFVGSAVSCPSPY